MIPLLLLILAQATRENALPKEAREAFEKAAEFEVYSLDPKRRNDGDFHRWKSLGKTTVKDDLAKSVREAVLQGIAEKDITPFDCFEPRHGIRYAHEGKTYDLVICYSCLSGYLCEGEKEWVRFLTSAEPAKLLRKVLSDAKVPLPEK